MHVTELHEGVCSLCWYMEMHSNHLILVIVPHQRQQKLSWDWSVWCFQSEFIVNIQKVVGLNSTDVLHSSLAVEEDGKVWMKIFLVSPSLPYDLLSILAFIGLQEDIWRLWNYREETKCVHFSLALQSQLSLCRAPVTVQMVQLQWPGKDPVTFPAKVSGPSEDNICQKSSFAQSPILRVLDLVPIRSSSLEESLKKWKVFFQMKQR